MSVMVNGLDAAVTTFALAAPVHPSSAIPAAATAAT